MQLFLRFITPFPATEKMSDSRMSELKTLTFGGFLVSLLPYHSFAARRQYDFWK